jgi:hypothetical protein
VKELNVVSSNFPVPTVIPLSNIAPVMFNEPVNSCESSNESPNLVEPLS